MRLPLLFLPCAIGNALYCGCFRPTTTEKAGIVNGLAAAVEFSLDWLLTGKGCAPDDLNKPMEELLKVAQQLPEYVVSKLTRQGSDFLELIEHASHSQISNGRE